ncbi:methyltransferase [Bradyrhizobium sp. BWC-3-1]|uniref:methyltransferase n=1 Tax=Bradyrhizobium sp. BWC-3-1 TaxID=3080012 RepID=UPI00293F3A4A|nr:methyltransferase [Bradyrhizobium sp. BWC-3-1]WOH60137.1 methyltransferase [Bradyrhizobium sp. BWC-3-1]
MSSPQAAAQLSHLVQSQRVTAIIYVAAKLGIAELLRNGSRPLGELSEATGANKQALRRLLAALSTVGICSVAEERYALTELGACLDGAAPQSLKNWTIFEGAFMAKSWIGLLDSIMTGKSAAQLLGLDNSFDLMERDPEMVDIFNAAMMEGTRRAIPDILRAYNFGASDHIMDVGGGSGELLGAIAGQYPHLGATIFDLPRCAESANDHLRRIGLGDRVKFIAGDFFQTIPSIADVIVMKHIIHDWNDERSLAILANCRRVLPGNGVLLLVERIMPEFPSASDEHREHTLTDLLMLRGPGGLERTEKQYAWLFRESGFTHTATYPAGRLSIIEAKVG